MQQLGLMFSQFQRGPYSTTPTNVPNVYALKFKTSSLQEHGDAQQQSLSKRGKELSTVPTLLPRFKLRT